MTAKEIQRIDQEPAPMTFMWWAVNLSRLGGYGVILAVCWAAWFLVIPKVEKYHAEYVVREDAKIKQAADTLKLLQESFAARQAALLSEIKQDRKDERLLFYDFTGKMIAAQNDTTRAVNDLAVEVRRQR